jgi:glycerophosphoryl diester phosphodiesterase
MFRIALIVITMPSFAQHIIAHRGASHDAPENTLATFKLAWEQGADGIEGDFYLTKDGQIICIHDADTKRVAGVDLKVAQTDFAELRKLDVGSWKDPKFKGEKMPTLDEVLATVPPGKMFFIEIKCGPEILPAVEAAIARSKVSPEQLRIICFKANVVEEARKLMPKVKTQWLTGYKQDKQSGAWTPTTQTVFETLKKSTAGGLGAQANLEHFTREVVERVNAMGLETNAWTVDDVETARKLRTMGVWAITTNRPGWLREQMKGKPLRHGEHVPPW